jgi:hypothetical protein
MGVKVTIFVIAGALLWSGLSNCEHFPSSKQREFSVAQHVIQTALVSNDDLAWKKSLTPQLIASVVRVFRTTNIRKTESQPVAIYKRNATRYYLLFRVLRH